MCDCPSNDELFRSIDRWIDERRWQLISVGFEEASGSRWTYSIGLIEGFGHPELVVAGGCCAACGGWVINQLGDRIAAGERWPMPTDEPVPLDGGPLVHLRPVPDECWTADWFAAWVSYYGSKSYAPPAPAAVQVVVGDAGGRFPWEPGCDEAMAASQRMPLAPVMSRSMRRRTARHRR